jgi:hypothetical protein
MKNKLLYTLLCSVLLTACSDEEYPELEPYIYFANNINYYVVDTDIVEEYSIKGSFSAEGMIQSVSIDGNTMTEDSIGNFQTSLPIDHKVDLTGFSGDRTIPFILHDKRGGKVSTEFYFYLAKPIETHTIEIGAQGNSQLGFFLSLEDFEVYSVTEFIKSKKDEDGICFGFDRSKEEPLLLSPSALINKNIIQEKGSKIVSIGNVSDMSRTEFLGIENDAIMRNLNDREYRTYEFRLAMDDNVYLFKTSTGKRGLLYVQSIVAGTAGNISVIIKMET